MIAFAYIECASVGLDTLNSRGNHYIGIGISVAVRVGAQIVRDEIGADLEILGNRFPMIAGDTRREILWGFYAAGGGFDRQTRNRNGRARAARVGIENLLPDENPLRRIGVFNVDGFDISRNRDRFVAQSQACEGNVQSEGLAGVQSNRSRYVFQARSAGSKRVRARWCG